MLGEIVKKLFICVFFCCGILLSSCSKSSDNISKSSGNLNLIEEKAKQGDSESQYNMGVFYMNGEGITQDYKKAIEWFSKAAESNDSEAQYNIGIIYVNGGYGIQKDLVKAVYWF